MLDYSSIGKRIKRLRLQKHMTQEALSEKIDISAKHLSNIENNNAHPSIETLVAIANILECSLDYFVLENIVETQETNYNQEFINIMKSCTTQEKRILIDILYAVRKILKENPGV